MSDQELLEALTGWLGSGRIDNTFILPVLRDLARTSAKSASAASLLESIQAHAGTNFQSLAAHIRSRRRTEASRCLQRKKAGDGNLGDFADILGDLPLNAAVGWVTLAAGLNRLRSALSLLKDRLFLEQWKTRAPRTCAAVDRSFAQALPGVSRFVDPESLIELLEKSPENKDISGVLAKLKELIKEREAAGVKQAQEYLSGSAVAPPANINEHLLPSIVAGVRAAAKAPEQNRVILDALCAWPTSCVAPLIRSLAAEASLTERAELLLTLRFNEPINLDWSGWDSWLSRAEEQDRKSWQDYSVLAASKSLQILLLWIHAHPEVPDEIKTGIEDRVRGDLPAATSREFLDRQGPLVHFDERGVFGEAPVRPLPPESIKRPEPPAAARAASSPVRAPEPEAPSIWNEHLLPFFANNWPMLTGIAMVVLGSSLLAYYTWDKHWFVRFTILPALLGGFTAVLARAGSWLEKRSETFKATADMLRGAAIALLPANFMAVALLARDPQVTHKEMLVPAVALIYLLAFGRSLRRWCSAVHPDFGNWLGHTLLLLNSLVILGPLIEAFEPSGSQPWFWLGAGFHVGFAAMAASIIGFLRSGPSRKILEEGRVPWFFGVSLVSTFLQVFLWVHGFMNHLPQVHTYACMMIAAGGLVLFAERRSWGAEKPENSYGRESFLGYSMILLGLFMGASNQQMRLVSMEFAGCVWLGQAFSRRDILHSWIAFTLLLLGGGSLATWDFFQGQWIPMLGLALAVAAGLLGAAFRRSWFALEDVGNRMQVAALNITTVLAVLVQWHYNSPPIHAAAVLLGVAGLMAWRAHKDQNLIYVHAVMAVLAVSLPYLGFADMSGRTLRGNNVVFGLSFLSIVWILLARLRGAGLLLNARSTVLLVYGAVALSAMALRVYFEQGRPESMLPQHAAMALGGPLLMAAALGMAAYYSRSLLPALVAAVILVVLMPQLRAEIQHYLPFIHWGSGLMSSVCSAALTAECFALRAFPALKDLGEGDKFAGRVPFPLERRDHSLFTMPLVTSALFLAVKVDTWNLARNLVGDGIPLKAALALGIAGLSWVLLAIYFREKPEAKALGHFGWTSAVAGIVFGYYDRASDPQWHQAAFLSMAAVNALYVLYRHWLERQRIWAHDLLTAPLRSVISVSTVLLFSAAIWTVVDGAVVGMMAPLLLLLAADSLWLGLSDESPVYGILLFVGSLVSILAWACPGSGPLMDRLTPQSAYGPALLFLGGIQIVHIMLEPAPSWQRRLRAVSDSFLALGTCMIVFLGLYALSDAIAPRALSNPDCWLLLAVVLLTARAQRCGPLALLAICLAYLDLFSPQLSALSNGFLRFEFLASPWRLVLLSFVMAALGWVGTRVSVSWPAFLSGPYAQGVFDIPPLPWLEGPLLVLSSWAVLRHAAHSDFRNAEAQLWTPFLGAAAVAIVGASRGSAALCALASIFLTLGNIHVVRFFLGAALKQRGLLENHLLALGTTAALIEFSAGKALSRREAVIGFINRVTLTGAGFILVLLSGTYFIRPDLEFMTNTRFIVSGAMAYIAGRFFHRAARRPDAGEAPYAAIWEGLYHFSLTTSIWCAALLIPWFRNPYAAFPALGLPVLYFYLRAEFGAREGEPDVVARYRNTAAALCFFMIILYGFRGAFQMVLFPNAPLGTEHYHFNAPFVIILALIMLRLHGLGGTAWLAFYGGLSLMVGSYFSLTRIPGLSPFEHPMPAAWCAIALGHFWMLFSSRPSPLKEIIKRLAGIADAHWASLSSSWGLFLLAATQAGLLSGVADYSSNTYMVAPLLLGGASLLAHQGAIRKSHALFVFAALEFMAALHADFFVASYLPKDQIVWTLLFLWGCVLAYGQSTGEGTLSAVMGEIAFWSALSVFFHVLYLGPDSTAGLWAFADGACLAALTPKRLRQAESSDERLMALGVVFAPTWLVYFGHYGSPFSTRALMTTAALLATGFLARWVQSDFAARYASWERKSPRLSDHAVSLLAIEGYAVNSALLYLVFALTASVQVLEYDSVLAHRDLSLVLGLYVASAYAWFHEGRLRRSMSPYFLLQFCLLGFFAVIRRQLMLSIRWWNYEYDVWASLLVSYSLAGAKQILPLGPKEVRIPLLGTLLTMPVAVMIWVLLHNLGTNTVLLVIGLYSLMFSYMGKDDRESPYHIVAIGGFVVFICIVFWTKLELRVVQAYIIPVGLGVLTLLQMFREKIAPEIK